MYNTFTYNGRPYNSTTLAPVLANQDAIVFNNFSLQNTIITTSILQPHNEPSREYTVRNIPRNDGKFAVGDFYREKIIKMKGTITTTTNILLEEKIEEFQRALSLESGILDIKKNDVVKRYLATLVNGNVMFDGERGSDITRIPFDLQFKVIEPFGHDVDYTARTFFNTIDLDFDEQMDNEGTARAKPIIILNFTAATSVTAVTFTNNTRGEAIKITENITAGDYLRFDSETLEVTLNGTVIDYDGRIDQSLNPLANSVNVTITGTSATYDLTLKHKNSFL